VIKLVEPLSTTAATIATEETARNTALAAEEVARNAALNEGTKALLYENINELSKPIMNESFKEAVDYSEKLLFRNNFNDIIKNPSFNHLNKIKDKFRLNNFNTKEVRELLHDSNLKGQLGEALTISRNSDLGNITEQLTVNEGANRLDHLLETTSNTEINTLKFGPNGDLISETKYLPKGSKVAIEVKNGGIDYLEREISSGHLINQVQAGKEVSDMSTVVINNDAAFELLNEPLRAEKILKAVKDAGGEIEVGLPTYNEQFDFLIKTQEV